MSAADRLSLRNDLIAMLAEIDERMVYLAAQPSSNRVVAEFRLLMDKRDEVADFLKDLNAEPAPMPVSANETRVP